MLLGDWTFPQREVYCVKAPRERLQSYMRPLYCCNASSLLIEELPCCTTETSSKIVLFKVTVDKK